MNAAVVPPAVAHPMRHHAEDVANAVEVFSGDDRFTVRAFIASFEAAALQFGWSDAQMAMYCKRFVSGTAKSLLRALQVHTWHDIRCELLAEFASAMSASAVHKMLASRRKHPGESPQQFSIAMREIAAMGQVDEIDLVSYIVDGIARDKSERLFFAGATDFNTLRILLNRYQDIVSASSAPAHTEPRNPFAVASTSTVSASRPRCYNCQEVGHFASSCGKVRRPAACFVCGQAGHVQAQCPRRQQQQNQVANIEYERGWRNGACSVQREPYVDAGRVFDSASAPDGVQQCRQAATDADPRAHTAPAYYHPAPIVAPAYYHPVPIAAPAYRQPASIVAPAYHQPAPIVVPGSALGQLNEMTPIENDFNEQVSLSISIGNANAIIKISALMDTGSPSCFIQAKYVPPAFMCDSVRSDEFFGLNGSRLCVLGTICGSILFRGQKADNVRIHVVKDGTMKSAAILGRSFINPQGLSLVKGPRDESQSHTAASLSSVITEVMNIDTSDNIVEPGYEINTSVPPQMQRALHELVADSVHAHERFDNKSSSVQCVIRLLKDEQFYCAPRRLSYHQKEKIKVILDDLLAKNIIRSSQSPYSSPIVPVPKKNGELRMCVDYRALNKLTTRDNYPLPLIEDQMDLLYGKTFFSCLDLQDGFHHVSMFPESIPLTSFVTPHGQYEYLRMPFGLKNAPSVFQRYINSLFRHLIDSNKILLYMDDIMVATDNLEDHLSVLKDVFEVIRQNGLKLRLAKCKFFLQEVDYLGYRVNSNGIKPNQENIDAVRGFPTPKNVRDVHSFLGLCSYFRKFISHYAIISKPLYDLLRKDAVFKFDEQEKKVFEFLKDCLTASPVLAIYSPKDETELHCDASALGYGAILLQRKADSKFHPVFYFSKRTTDAESRYHSFELETLAIVNALKRFRVYLEGIPFKIVTDCNSLTLTLHKKQINPRIARWGLELENFNYKIEHRPNERMRHVDSLSRIREVNVIEQNSLEHILAVEQGRDQNISKIRQSLESKSSTFPSFELQDGLVYKKIEGKTAVLCSRRYGVKRHSSQP